MMIFSSQNQFIFNSIYGGSQLSKYDISEMLTLGFSEGQTLSRFSKDNSSGFSETTLTDHGLAIYHWMILSFLSSVV